MYSQPCHNKWSTKFFNSMVVEVRVFGEGDCTTPCIVKHAAMQA